jgi:diamine N-acetyltransferase
MGVARMLVLKNVSVKDVSLLETIGRETYQQHFAHLWSRAGLEKYLGEHFTETVLTDHVKTKSISYRIAFYDQLPAGLVKIKFDQQMPAPPFDRGMELEKIYLLETFTGKGLGKEIITGLLAEAKENNFPFVWLDVLKSNQRAKKLYTALGFDVVGEIGFATDVAKIDMWIMRHDLIR